MLRGDENVLEIGTGSGYQAAVLSKMARSVHTIERHPDLAQRAEAILNRIGIRQCLCPYGRWVLGWPPAAPYQAILVTAAAPEIPLPLIEQLDEDGRLVIPVGGHEGQKLERWRKTNGQIYRETSLPGGFCSPARPPGLARRRMERRMNPDTSTN